MIMTRHFSIKAASSEPYQFGTAVVWTWVIEEGRLAIKRNTEWGPQWSVIGSSDTKKCPWKFVKYYMAFLKS